MASQKSKRAVYSQMIFDTLSAVGFDHECISRRSNYAKEISKYFTKYFYSSQNMYIENVGAFREGTTLSDSDLDYMMILLDAVCVDKVQSCRGFNILQADYTNTSPGYVKIALTQEETESFSHVLFKHSELYENPLGHAFVSSPILRNFVLQSSGLIKLFCETTPEGPVCNGPAVTNTLKTNIAIDQVMAILYNGESHLTTWSSRIRYFSWPSASLMKKISDMEGYVVPVGDKLSDCQNIEWRVCYTTAEMKLIKSLNDVQLKLYILLKYVARDIKKNVCKDMSSYIVKNIVFWIVESEPERAFTASNLVSLFNKSLMYIKYCLLNNHLPSYIIAERNLLRWNMNGKEKSIVIEKLAEYKNCAIDKIPKLFECMQFVFLTLKRPEIDVYRIWRNKIEFCFQAIGLCKLKYVDLRMILNGTASVEVEWSFFQDKLCLPLVFEILFLVVPDWIYLVMTGQSAYMQQLFMSRLHAMPFL